MITIATLFWQANKRSLPFSSMYDESWVEKLYRGFARNLTVPFRFVCYTDRERTFSEDVLQKMIASPEPGYGDCIQPYEMGEPMILVGLDTIVCGNIDELADYCLHAPVIALPRDPYHPSRACNGVALVPGGNAKVWQDHTGENDMEWMRKQPHAFIDDLFPGKVISYKGRVMQHGVGSADIVYFHGEQKPHQLPNDPLILAHWR